MLLSLKKKSPTLVFFTCKMKGSGQKPILINLQLSIHLLSSTFHWKSLGNTEVYNLENPFPVLTFIDYV